MADIWRNHHVIAKAYQKRFALDERIRLVYKYANRPPEKIKHVRKAFVEKGFLTVNSDVSQNDDLEDMFARAESEIFKRLQLIKFPNLTYEGAEAIKALGALLFARSYRMHRHGPRMSRETIDEQKSQAYTNKQMVELFWREHRRAPLPGELAEIVEEFGMEFIASGTAQVTGILNMYQKAVAKFDPFYVSLYDATASRHGLVISDNPVVIARGEGLIDVDNGQRLIAIGDADCVYFPLDRWTAVCLTVKPEGHHRLFPSHVSTLNNLMWRSAHQLIGAHPEEDWASACSVRKQRPEFETRSEGRNQSIGTGCEG